MSCPLPGAGRGPPAPKSSRIKWASGRANCNRAVRPPRRAPPETAHDPRAGGRSRRGSAPDRRARSTVVMVLTSGWKLSDRRAPSWRRRAPTVTRPSRVVDERRTASPSPARRPASRAAARPSRTRSRPLAPSSRCSAFRSIAASSSATTRNSASFLSFRNRFLVWPPGICAAQRARLLDREQRRMARRSGARCRAGRGRRTGRRGWRAWIGGIRAAIGQVCWRDRAWLHESTRCRHMPAVRLQWPGGLWHRTASAAAMPQRMRV